MKVRSVLFLAVALLGGGALAADDLKSGPQVGAGNDRNGFYPQWLTGPSAGQRRCPV
jgi:hypothetical protein